MKNTHRRIPGLLFCIFSVLLLVGVFISILIFFVFNPLDRVSVTTSELPSDTVFICFVSESNGLLENMDWYPRSELQLPFTMRPSECAWSSLELQKVPKIDWDAYVQWRCGERYGVVTRSRGGIWRATWFDSKDIPIAGHWRIFGKREVNFDLRNRNSTILQEEQLKKLRLSEVPFLEKE